MRPVAVNASVLQHPSLPYLYLCPKWDTRKEGGRGSDLLCLRDLLSCGFFPFVHLQPPGLSFDPKPLKGDAKGRGRTADTAGGHQGGHAQQLYFPPKVFFFVVVFISTDVKKYRLVLQE